MAATWAEEGWKSWGSTPTGITTVTVVSWPAAHWAISVAILPKTVVLTTIESDGDAESSGGVSGTGELSEVAQPAKTREVARDRAEKRAKGFIPAC
jgi:hypothetical protein